MVKNVKLTSYDNMKNAYQILYNYKSNRIHSIEKYALCYTDINKRGYNFILFTNETPFSEL